MPQIRPKRIPDLGRICVKVSARKRRPHDTFISVREPKCRRSRQMYWNGLEAWRKAVINRLCGCGILIFVTRNKTPPEPISAEVPAAPETIRCETLRIV